MEQAIAPGATDPALEPIRDKVLAGERLTHADGVALFSTRDLFTLGELANLVRERRHGRTAYYNINRHVNYTNFCVLRCKFCSFYRSLDGRSGLTPVSNTAGYEYSLDEILGIAEQAVAAGATELHVVGGLHPRLPFDFYTTLCRELKRRCPQLHIKAFTAIEIIHFTRIARPRMSIREVLTALREAGLDSLPGGGAEIFDDRVHAEVFKSKVGESGWFDVHREAHELGIPSNATMLYGHVETIAERVTHLIKLREHQDESLARRKAAFQTLIPLSFIPDDSALADLPGPTGLDDLRTLAASRLMLDNFAHVKAFWIMQTPKLSQVALNWGVDDFDGTVVWYDITKREGHGTTRQEMTVDQIRRLMREAGCAPVERDTLYRPVVRS
ncbi:MAG: aminofutalosine synthase MqnE [Phycisphaerales bacterium]|nr:aminofutalosine synthase MqnE [Phycisphaerales bacterium]